MYTLCCIIFLEENYPPHINHIRSNFRKWAFSRYCVKRAKQYFKKGRHSVHNGISFSLKRETQRRRMRTFLLFFVFSACLLPATALQPVVLINGLAGSNLNARLNGAKEPHVFCDKKKEGALPTHGAVIHSAVPVQSQCSHNAVPMQFQCSHSAVTVRMQF